MSQQPAKLIDNYNSVLMDLADSSLEEYLHASDVTEEECFNIARSVALGVDYLHKLNPPIVHGDLKKKNLLVSF